MRLTRTTRAAAAVLVALLTTACAAGNDPDAEIAQTDGNDAGGGSGAGELSGTIAVSGSSTVEPITSLAAELFREQQPGVDISVDGPGTGDGFELFCQGETDISDASRAIQEQEIQACEDNGVEYVELKVGIDGIAVLTNPANDAVTCLSFNDLYALTGPESEGFERWSDADALAAELGSTPAAPYPDAPLEIFGPGTESGTYDTYVEFVIEGLAEERGQEDRARKDYSANSDDNVIVQGIVGSRTSLGWVGFAFYEENRDRLKAIEVDGGEGCVAPDADTIASGEYPMSRPLFIYVNRSKAEQKPALAAFVDFYLSDQGNEAVREVGYVQLTDQEWSATNEAWAGR